MPDLVENLIVAEPAIGIAHIDLKEHVFQRFIIRSIGSQTPTEQTI